MIARLQVLVALGPQAPARGLFHGAPMDLETFFDRSLTQPLPGSPGETVFKRCLPRQRRPPSRICQGRHRLAGRRWGSTDGRGPDKVALVGP